MRRHHRPSSNHVKARLIDQLFLHVTSKSPKKIKFVRSAETFSRDFDVPTLIKVVVIAADNVLLHSTKYI